VWHPKLQLNTKTQKIADDLFLIPLTPPMTGFSNFFSAWLYRGKITCLIDVGPSSTAPDLLRALQELKIDQLDYILLTHIHLDHAGAIGEIAEVFSQPPIVCHPLGLSHLTEPSRLWEGTKKVLGSMALEYGPIKPIAKNRLLEASRFHNEFITPIFTPGHAAHHVSFQTEKYLFAGEAGGVHRSMPANRYYLRPATPPRFFLDVALQSLDALIACRAKTICYGHFGIQENAVKMLQTHRKQLLLWERLIKEEMAQQENGIGTQDHIVACLTRLLKEDPLMAIFDQLPPDVQVRETNFLQNSISGYIGWLETGSKVQGSTV
jgi:glyoxylase-like metal-dependent hydrolase (beta-lactamase superfamily II)